jgi:hypothetical protein
VCSLGSSSNQTYSARLDARTRATEARGRLIVDDDGDLVFTDAASEGAAPFLDQRLTPLAEVGVGSVAWCIMWGIAVGKGEPQYWETQRLGRPLNAMIPDPTPLMVAGARQAQMELFGSIRMNDTHDAFGKPHGRLTYPLKVEHPEWLLGDESQKGDFASAPEALVWSGLDFAVEQVRDDRLWWICNTADRYDLDGIDLNFFHMPWYFKPGRAEQGMPLMTDLVCTARRILDEVSEKRGRPMLLGVRVPDTSEACARIGLDIITWLREGLVDRLLVGGGYAPFTTPVENFVALGHAHDVPVYPCINCGVPPGGPDAALQGAASNIYWSGADGIYMWNYQYRDVPKLGYGRPTEQGYALLKGLRSPSKLQYQDKIWGVENARAVGPYAIASHGTQLPVALGSQALAVVKSIRLRVGDDIAAAQSAGLVAGVTLTLALQGSTPRDTVVVQLNGVRLRPLNGVPVPDEDREDVLDRKTYEIPQEIVIRGDNAVAVWIEGRGNRSGAPVILEEAWVHVKYV